MDKDNSQAVEKKLGIIVELLRHLLAVELLRGGMSMPEIGKRLHVATATVVKMLKGVKKEK
ncbi:MAG: hypothetical protein Greene041679_379 [Parcubacteria group bacterium Greene0416_79]|nr:MAG: hypothetical protein Greene041679_379 [Parcubacteria group bacterium Greene0416_79]